MAVKWFDGPLGLARNHYQDNGDRTVSIWLTRGLVARVSALRFAEVAPYRWCATSGRNGPYAVTMRPTSQGKQRTLFMHRLLLPDATIVDHKDRDTLNNTYENLRAADALTNAVNRSKQRDNTSGFVGVCLHRQSGLYRARVGDSRWPKYQSLHKTAEGAARARDAAALRLYGPFAVTNESLGLLPPLPTVLPQPDAMAAD